MKKILSIMLAVAIICMGAIAVHADGDVGQFNCYIDQGGTVSVPDGNPSRLAVTSFEVGLGTESVSIRGWLLSEFGPKSFKYYIDAGDAKDIAVEQGSRDDVFGQFSAYDRALNATPGVNIEVPLTGLDAGEYVFTFIFVDNNGAEAEFYEADITIVAGGEVADPLAEMKGYSFDEIHFNDTPVVSSMAKNWFDENYPDGVIDAAAENLSKVGFYGWVGFKGEIDQLGYKLDGVETYGDFKLETGQDVIKAGGQYATRFRIWVPTVFEGGKEARLIAKLTNGTVVELPLEFSINGNPNGTVPGDDPGTDPGTEPGTDPTPVTGDATMVLFIVAAAAIVLVILRKKAF